MKSIRQCTFETNSSSAHSLTLCMKSLREKLQSRDLFYVGPFEKDSESDGASVNKIEEKNCITIEEAIKRVKDYLTANPDFGLPDDFNLDILTPEFVKENYWNKDYELYRKLSQKNVWSLAKHMNGSQSFEKILTKYIENKM